MTNNFRIDGVVHMTAEALNVMGTPLSEEQLRHILRHVVLAVSPALTGKSEGQGRFAVGELATVLDTYANTIKRRVS